MYFSLKLMVIFYDRWQFIREWLHNLVKTFFRRFRWGFLIAGFVALTMAGISWKLETSESYWIWHRYIKDQFTLLSLSLSLSFICLILLQSLACHNIHSVLLLPLFQSNSDKWG